MTWHTNVTIGDLHYLRSKFAEQQGFDVIRLGSFNRATEVFYYNKQFAVNGDNFLTWAFLAPEWEANYLLGGMGWLEHINAGSPWIMEAFAPNLILSALKELSHLSNKKNIRFASSGGKIKNINLTRFDKKQ